MVLIPSKSYFRKEIKKGIFFYFFLSKPNYDQFENGKQFHTKQKNQVCLFYT